MNPIHTFDQLYIRELRKQKEAGFNITVCVVFGFVAAALAIFKHPLWLGVSVLMALFWLGHRWMHGGEHDLTGPAAGQACEFMLQVQQHGHSRSLLPLSSVAVIMNLALSETCENESVQKSQLLPGAIIARNLHLSCAHCDMHADTTVMGQWWAAKAAFNPYSEKSRYLRPDGTCAKCGNSEGWFESRCP